MPHDRRCDVLLLDPEATLLPDHLCLDVWFETVWRFARGHFPLWRLTGEAPRPYWPLPAGERSLARWMREHGAPPMDMDLLQPLIERPDAWISLVVVRRLGANTVRLFGLVEEAEQAADSAWPAETTWNAVEPVIHTERVAAPRSPHDPVLHLERQLWTWYERVVLGREVRTGGRPPGPSTPPERLREEYERALAALRREHTRITQETVARSMNISVQSLRRYIRDGIVPALPSQSGR